MKLSKIQSLFLAGFLGFGVAGANAGLIIKTNTTGGVVDRSQITQSVVVSAADLAGMVDSIVDVNLTVDFSKCGSSANIGGCTGSSGNFTYSREIVFNLAFGGSSIGIVNRGTFSGQNGDARVTQIYDDEAAIAVGGSSLQNGSFRPVMALTAFDGASALGQWDFTFRDTTGADPLVVHSWTLAINLRDGGSSEPVPVPATVALLGLGLMGLGWSRRRKV